MAAPSKPASTGRSWGSLLQQAVAGVESRLDTILAEGAGEDTSKPTKLANATTPAAPATAKTDGGISRSTSNSSRTNDRLQERLARAIAAKSTSQKPENLGPASTPSRAGSPVTVSNSPRRSVEGVASETEEKKEAPTFTAIVPQEITSETTERAYQDTLSTEVYTDPNQSSGRGPDPRQPPNGHVTEQDEEAVPRKSADILRPGDIRELIDQARELGACRQDFPFTAPQGPEAGTEKLHTDYEAKVKQLQSDLEICELQRQEEVHSYIERIDALQAKLQYLARESAEIARKESNAAPSGTLEKKLADRDEQVALLMEEGQQLSKKELTHLMTIKKLRSKLQDDGKELAEAHRRQELAENEAAAAKDQLKRSKGLEQQLNERQKLVSQLQKDIELVKADRDTKNSVIANLKARLEANTARENEAEAKAANEALQREKKRAIGLEDDLANARIEKNLAVERAQAQIKELREKLDKEAERSRMTELEMKSEQQMLESKLEMMRARAEEVSSGLTGDAHAKLLRQIETLQTQYAVASENWQGIEASLVARATSLEKERNEATKREGETRRRARELNVKAKRDEEALEEARANLLTFKNELNEAKSLPKVLQKRAEEVEVALTEARKAFELERQAWKLEAQQRIDEERHRWHEEVSTGGSINHNRAESPVASSRRGLTSEFLSLQNLQLRRASARSVNSDSPTAERALPRRPSALPLRSSGHGTPTRQDSLASIARNGEASEAPSTVPDHDEFFEHHSPSSPQQTINDMVSVSTAGAGPSVQLVERMSSAVRRLESEKVATKEDLIRLSAQRDEARAEIVALMKEVEAKRDSDRRVAELEAQVKEINSRYETTLEMLGEKSELVDELRSDIDDIKAMYRELVERTVK